MRRLTAVLLSLGLVAAACSDDSGLPRSQVATASEASAEATATTPAPTAPAPVTTLAPPVSEWESVKGDENCMCADGSDWNLWVRPADPTKVVLFFQGGGACFSAGTCAFDSGSYDTNVGSGDDPSQFDGVFDLANPANPLADWSFVFVPYCTGDVHIGDNTQDYGDGLVVEHKGFTNASYALDELQRRFPDPAEVFVTGSSAGGVPAPLFAGLAADRFPDASITALADGSGAYPDEPAINAGIGALWGTFGVRPDWPETANLTPEQWSIPGLFVTAGLHDPDIVMARYDNAFDQVQSGFAALVGIDTADLVSLIDGNAAKIEQAGVQVDTYVAPGNGHTILGRPGLYTLSVEGVPFVDWLTALVERQPVDDVHCEACES